MWSREDSRKLKNRISKLSDAELLKMVEEDYNDYRKDDALKP